MVKVEVQRNQLGEIVGITVKGHSGYAARGQDIVCAGVSSLTQSALLGLKKFSSTDFKIEEGFLQISLPSQLAPEARMNANVILETMILGLEQIMEHYPRYIKITAKA